MLIGGNLRLVFDSAPARKIIAMFTILGLGSNRSFDGLDSISLLNRACDLLEPFFIDFNYSSVYRTKPMYVENQDCFYNMAVSGYVKISAEQLLSEIHRIESLLGRNRKSEIRNGPRSIDIDIEIFGNEKICHLDSDDPMKNLEIPHPRLCERAFVLVPLLEVLPESADIKNTGFLKKSLDKLGNQGVELWKSRQSFRNSQNLM